MRPAAGALTAAALIAAGVLVATPSFASSGSPVGSPLPATSAVSPASSAPSPASSVASPATSAVSPSTSASTKIPVYAYFYQWFSTSSWNRAKQDYPLAGRYSSDNVQVLKEQISEAKGAGIDGFFTSWKNTATLNRRLGLLINAAKPQHFDLGVVYEALDFSRHPLPVATVQRDMVFLVDTWGSSLTSQYYGRPVIIWTGTDQYSTADVQAVKTALGNRAYLLAASRTVAGYQRVAGIVDGEAYYWSSADPTSSTATIKLTALGQAVHAHHGLWFAPAASGYDGRDLGGTRVIGRNNGLTLQHSLDNAYRSSPDAVAVISWNEWSENTYIEPGEEYGNRELVVLKAYLQARARGLAPGSGIDSSDGGSSNWTGARAAVTLGVLTLGTIIGLPLLGRRRSRDRRPSARSHRAAKGQSREPEPHEPLVGTVIDP
jgi:Glycosyl hydrolase family 71